MLWIEVDPRYHQLRDEEWGVLFSQVTKRKDNDPWRVMYRVRENDEWVESQMAYADLEEAKRAAELGIGRKGT